MIGQEWHVSGPIKMWIGEDDGTVGQASSDHIIIGRGWLGLTASRPWENVKKKKKLEKRQTSSFLS